GPRGPTSVVRTSSRQSADISLARVGPQRRLQQLTQLNGCHPRPVNGYLCGAESVTRTAKAWCGLSAGMAIGFLSWIASSEERIIKPVKEGRVPSPGEKGEPPRKGASRSGYIADAWSPWWRAWQLLREPPEVDSEKRMILIPVAEAAVN